MKKIKKIDYALVISNVGGPGKFGYKQSFQKDSYINQEVENIFKQLNKQYTKYPFDISGSDERQFSTQGLKLILYLLQKTNTTNIKNIIHLMII